jgi:predicted nucleic acid-binding Zn ribbon protein
MTRRSFARVGDFLPSVLNHLGLQKRFNERKVVEKWADVVGPELAQRSRATRFEKGTLFVHVEHGAWMQELHFMERELVRKLRAECPGVDLSRIRFGAREVE